MCVHVCKPTGQHFRAMLRKSGDRRYLWTFVGPKRKHEKAAMQDAVREWSKGGYAQGVVSLCADWYEPLPVFVFRKANRSDF